MVTGSTAQEKPIYSQIILLELLAEQPRALPANVSEPTKIAVDAPYHLALQSGAVVLEERPSGIAILLLTEVPNISLEVVNKFMVHAANQQYIKDVEAYLAGTANFKKPRLVEYGFCNRQSGTTVLKDFQERCDYSYLEPRTRKST